MQISVPNEDVAEEMCACAFSGIQSDFIAIYVKHINPGHSVVDRILEVVVAVCSEYRLYSRAWHFVPVIVVDIVLCAIYSYCPVVNVVRTFFYADDGRFSFSGSFHSSVNISNPPVAVRADVWCQTVFSFCFYTSILAVYPPVAVIANDWSCAVGSCCFDAGVYVSDPPVAVLYIRSEAFSPCASVCVTYPPVAVVSNIRCLSYCFHTRVNISDPPVAVCADVRCLTINTCCFDSGVLAVYPPVTLYDVRCCTILCHSSLSSVFSVNPPVAVRADNRCVSVCPCSFYTGVLVADPPVAVLSNYWSKAIVDCDAASVAECQQHTILNGGIVCNPWSGLKLVDEFVH